MHFLLVDYEGFYGSTCYSPNISFFNFSFLSSICCGNLCGEREKKTGIRSLFSIMLPVWTSAVTETQILMCSSCSRLWTLLIQRLSISHSRNVLLDTHFYLVSGILIPKYSCFWENHFIGPKIPQKLCGSWNSPSSYTPVKTQTWALLS